MSRKYYAQKDGEWVEPADDYKMRCCDCASTHRITFRVREGRVQFMAIKDRRSTAAARRERARRGEAAL